MAGPGFEPGTPRFSVAQGELHRVAVRCNIGIPGRFSVLRLAPYCGALRARWCQLLRFRQEESLCTLPTCCDGASALARVASRASPSLGRDYTRCRIRTSRNIPSRTYGELRSPVRIRAVGIAVVLMTADREHQPASHHERRHAPLLERGALQVAALMVDNARAEPRSSGGGSDVRRV